MNIKTVLKTSVAAAALVAVAAPAVVTPAHAGLNNGNKNSLVMSGQIVRALIYQDNGEQSHLFNADGVNTRSRLRWIASGQMTESVKIGGVVEMNFPTSNDGGSLGVNGETNSSQTTWGFRKTEITFTHKAAGKLSLGQSSVAGDGASTQSLLSHASIGSSHGSVELMRGSSFAQSTGAITTIGTGGVANYDPGREDRIRYDTPSFGGLKLSLSQQDSGASVGANYSGKFGGVSVSAAAFYRNHASSSTSLNATMGGSVAAKHDSGVAAEFGMTREDAETGTTLEGKNWHAGVGYAAALTNLGTTGFALTFNDSEDALSKGDSGDSWAITVNQNISAVGADLYAGYVKSSYSDTTATTYEDFTTIFAGTRLNF